LIFVAAAANDGANNDTKDVFPANSNTENMISVAASGESDAKPQWSNYGKAMVSLASPGENIMSTLPNNQYGNLSGTSMATPLVAGLVGFLRSQDPTLTGKQIRSLLQTTGTKVQIETACNCRVDAFNAVDHLLSKKPWVVPAAASLEVNGTVNVAMMNGVGPFTFSSSNASVLSVDTQGVAKGLAQGVATVTVTDANGVKAASLDYNVGQTASGPAPGDCPIGDVSLCESACAILPDLPFCKK
jgi:thermitase